MLVADRTKTCRDLAWDFALTSRMNVRYYQGLISRWKRIDNIARLAAALLASASVAGFFKDNGVDARVLAGMGVVSAILGVVGTIFQVPEKVRAYGVLLAEYTAHAGVFERLFLFGCTDDTVAEAIRRFEETEQREAKDDPTPDQKLLEQCRTDILKEIGAPAS